MQSTSTVDEFKIVEYGFPDTLLHRNNGALTRASDLIGRKVFYWRNKKCTLTRRGEMVLKPTANPDHVTLRDIYVIEDDGTLHSITSFTRPTCRGWLSRHLAVDWANVVDQTFIHETLNGISEHLVVLQYRLVRTVKRAVEHDLEACSVKRLKI